MGRNLCFLNIYSFFGVLGFRLRAGGGQGDVAGQSQASQTRRCAVAGPVAGVRDTNIATFTISETAVVLIAFTVVVLMNKSPRY